MNFAKIVWPMWILSQKFSWNFQMANQNLSTGELFTSKYVTLLQSFNRGTLLFTVHGWSKVTCSQWFSSAQSSFIWKVQLYFCNNIRRTHTVLEVHSLEKTFSASLEKDFVAHSSIIYIYIYISCLILSELCASLSDCVA